MKYKAAISDADILIHLAKADEIDVLSFLFTEIVIPQYVFNREIQGKAGSCLPVILKHIESGSLFRIIDREKDIMINRLARPVIEDKRLVVGRGESECAGYAAALGIPIILSNNSSEFKWLNENVMLTYYDVLTLNVHFGHTPLEIAAATYEKINGILDLPSGKDFARRQKEAFKSIHDNGWNVPLGL